MKTLACMSGLAARTHVEVCDAGAAVLTVRLSRGDVQTRPFDNRTTRFALRGGRRCERHQAGSHAGKTTVTGVAR